MPYNKNIDATMNKMHNNHEIWRTCPHCGEVWDARARGLDCPKCVTELKMSIKKLMSYLVGNKVCFF